VADGFEALGRALAEAGADALDFAAMLGRLSGTFAKAPIHPRAFRLRSIVHHLDRVGVQAVPIMAMMTFLVGAIIAQQGFFPFRHFGAEDYVVDLVAVLILREIGVLLVTIMAAGRSGSAYTAELGSMKMREETDALATMGFDPAEFLILPCVLALVIAVPALTFLGSISALAGGGVVAWAYAGMSPDIYIVRLLESRRGFASGRPIAIPSIAISPAGALVRLQIARSVIPVVAQAPPLLIDTCAIANITRLGRTQSIGAAPRARLA
jgi:phospholipid/cholesterol/gamma-HCH transport system permease protein